jgi:hypothetical protein
MKGNPVLYKKESRRKGGIQDFIEYVNGTIKLF